MAIPVIDDVRDAVRELLDEDDSTRLANGREGLHLLRSAARLPNVIFLDVSLPNVESPVLLEALEKDRRLRDVPLAIVGEHSSTDSEFDQVRTVDRSERLRLCGSRQLLLPAPLNLLRLVSIVRDLCPCTQGARSDA